MSCTKYLVADTEYLDEYRTTECCIGPDIGYNGYPVHPYILGMVIACCIRSLQTICKMRSMIKEGITEAEWTEKLIK